MPDRIRTWSSAPGSSRRQGSQAGLGATSPDVSPRVMGWLLPTLAYVLTLGTLGVTVKLALRTLNWQDFLPWTLLAYAVVVAFLLAAGQTGWRWQTGSWWAIASAALAVAALILLFVALTNGEASKVLPVSAAYPAATLVLSALFLGEHISAARVAGVSLVIGGVVLITAVR